MITPERLAEMRERHADLCQSDDDATFWFPELAETIEALWKVAKAAEWFTHSVSTDPIFCSRVKDLKKAFASLSADVDVKEGAD